FAKVRQRYVIAVKKGKPVIVVLDLERRPHPRRKLVYEAKETGIVASSRLKVFHLKTQGFPVRQINLHQLIGARDLADLDICLFLGKVKLQSDLVGDRMPVYAQDFIPRRQPG